MPYRVAVLDDPRWGPRIARLADEQADFEVVANVADAVDARDRLAELVPDLIIVDVRMPGLDGFGLLSVARKTFEPQFIIVTTREADAVRAFDEGAADFLLKPFSAERLALAFERARAALVATDPSRAGPAPAGRADAGLEPLGQAHAPAGDGTAAHDGPRIEADRRNGKPISRLAIRSGDRIVLLDPAKVSRFEAAGNYVKVFAGDQEYLVRHTLTRLESELDPERFRRIHRSAIVNLDHVRELRPWFGGDYLVRLRDGAELRLSRRYRKRVLG